MTAPFWLTDMTQRLFDRIPRDQVSPVVCRYGELVAYVLSDSEWSGVLNRFAIRALDVAMDTKCPPSVAGKPYWPDMLRVSCANGKAAVERGDQSMSTIATWAGCAADWADADGYSVLANFLLDQIEAEIERQP